MISNDWSLRKVEEIKASGKSALATGPFGSAISSKYFQTSGVPVIRGSNLSQDVGFRLVDEGLVFVSHGMAEKFTRSIARRGDLVFTCWGTIDQVGLIDERSRFAEYVVSNKQMKLTPDPQVADSLFLYYVFSSPAMKGRILNEGIGSSVPGFNLGQLRNIEVPLPPLPEQKAIAHILGTLDDKIELNRRMNETLEGMARALFKSWFVDFDPVRAKMDGRHPPGLSAEVAALFPDKLVHVDGELVPEGWLRTTLGEEVDFQTGFPFKSKLFTEKPPGTRLARGMNVKEGQFYWDSQARFWPSLTSDLEGYLLQPGDVLIGMDGSKVGKNWVRVRETDLPCLLVQRVARLRPADSIGENAIWILVGSHAFRYFVDAVKTGTSIPHISGSQIKSYGFIRPPRNDSRLFASFEQIVSPMVNRADVNLAESTNLEGIRDTLLPKLLSGELRVSDAEKFVDDHAA